MEIIRYDAGPRMSRVTEYNGVLYFGGHGPRPEFTGIKEQTRALTRRFDELFAQYGTDKDHMLFATIYMKDIAQRDEMNAAWEEWVNDGKGPARVCVQAELAEDYLLLEVSIIAVKK